MKAEIIRLEEVLKHNQNNLKNFKEKMKMYNIFDSIEDLEKRIKVLEAKQAEMDAETERKTQIILDGLQKLSEQLNEQLKKNQEWYDAIRG